MPMRTRFALLIITLAIFGATVSSHTVFGATLAEKLKGYILLQVEKNGEAWYVYPKTLTRFFLGRPADAFDIMRRLGLGISNANLAKIPIAGSSDTGDTALRAKMSGYILIQVEKNGEAWYVYPKDTHRYYLGRPDDAFSIMRSLGVGISNSDLAQIPVDSGIIYKTSNVVVDNGTFEVDYLYFDRKNPALKVTTDTGNNGNCATGCATFSLGTYVSRRSGFAGIHGTYFCPSEYPSCSGQVNFYFYPVLNSYTGVMVNADRLKFTTEPIVIFDTSNLPYFYHSTKDNFKSLQDIKNKIAAEGPPRGGSGVLRSAISNGPALVENHVDVVDPSKLDTKQATVKSYRGALGWKGDTIYLAVVRGATVTDSGQVMTAMGMDYALNLDGGGSTALYNAGRYLLGPGRNLPNAIVIAP